MGMSHNPIPIEGYAPLATIEQSQHQQNQYQQILHQQQQTVNHQQQQLEFTNQQTLISDGSTVYFLQTPNVAQATAQIIHEDAIKQPIFVVTDIQTNAIENNCAFIQVPNGNIIQMPSVAVPEVTGNAIVTATAPTATINLIQVPTINVDQSTFLVATTNDSNNLILCLPTEGLTLQTELTLNSSTNVELDTSQLTIADIQLNDEEDIESKTDKAKNWHLDSEITNRALIALSNNKSRKRATHIRKS